MGAPQPNDNKKIKTSDLVNSPEFKELVETSIESFRHKRMTRPEPKPGYKYNRDWFDRMDACGQLNTQFFVENIESIWLKKSSLSSETRKVIEAICTPAAHKLLAKMEKETPEMAVAE